MAVRSLAVNTPGLIASQAAIRVISFMEITLRARCTVVRPARATLSLFPHRLL